MIKKFPELYSRIGFLIDHAPKMDWMYASKSYSLNNFTEELRKFSPENLFEKLLEVLTSGRVNLDYFCPLIGDFHELDESIMFCDESKIHNISHSTIYFEFIEKEEYKLAKSFHFYFKERIPLYEKIETGTLMQKIYNAYPNLKVTVSYPVFCDNSIAYTNQVLILYS